MKKTLSLILLLILATSAAYADLSVHFLDVGQGDATLVVCDGEAMLIDGGSPSASQFLFTYLRQEVVSLSAIVATHPHDDHIGGLAAALNAVPVDVIYSPVTTWNGKTWKSLVKYASAQVTPIVIPQERDSFPLGGATVTILHCWPEAWAENDMSIVLRVDYGSTSFLFTGDAEEMSEYMMLTERVPLKADVLKVAHHGSRYCSSPEFIEAVAPSWAVISCGEGNPYGHPHEETLRALAGVNILCTDQVGTIVFHSNGQTLTVTTTGSPAVTAVYIGNRNSMKFHCPDCPSVADMAEHNKVPLASREEAIALGYKPCGNCKP